MASNARSVSVLGSDSVFGSEDAGLNGLDAFWAEAANTVIEGDFKGYKETYHEDAILVSESSQTSYLIGQALEG